MDLEVQGSLLQTADRLVDFVSELLRTSKTEEDLRIGFEKILDPLLKSIGVESQPSYERLGAEQKQFIEVARMQCTDKSLSSMNRLGHFFLIARWFTPMSNWLAT